MADSCRALVQNTPVVKPFEYYVGDTPDTLEAEALRIGYGMKNLRALVWRALSDFIFPHYRKNHCMTNILRALTNAHDVRYHLENFIGERFCYRGKSRDMYLRKVFPNLNLARCLQDLVLTNNWNAKTGMVPLENLLYADILLDVRLRGVYNNLTVQRIRPLPNALPYTAMAHVHQLLTRYGACLDSIDAFLRKHDPNESNNRRCTEIATRALRKRLRRALQETNKCDLIEEYATLGFPAGHTEHTLCADFTYEQLKDMVDGHPSKLFPSGESSLFLENDEV